MTTVEMNLFKDLVGIARADLEAWDEHTLPPTFDDWKTLFAWVDVQLRLPERRPRRVHCSKELIRPSQHLVGLVQLEQKFAQGDDLRPHLSRRLWKANLLGKHDPHDQLLNDWGIHHFHLGTTTDAKGMAGGNKEVLYAILEPDDVYLIQVSDHGFSNTALIEIVDANWPELMTEMALVAPHKAITSSEVGVARKAGVQTFVQIGDRIIAPRGLGYATSGHSVASMRQVDDWEDRTAQWEAKISADLAMIIEFARSNGMDVPEMLHFRLRREGSAFVAEEETILVRIPLPLWYEQPAAAGGGQAHV